MDRSEWDRKGIAKEVEAAKGTEGLAAKMLNEAIQRKVAGTPLADMKISVFDRNTAKEMRESFDLDIKAGDKIIDRIEVECGLYQHYWNDSLPNIEHRWTRGLSILYRKVEKSTQSKFFMKISKSGKSLFAVRWDWLFKKYEDGKISEDKKAILKNQKTGEALDTCKDAWLISWELAKESMASNDKGFVMDDWDRFAGMICDHVVEKTKAA